jgi:magnesium-transporting ATPase (P-type)
MRATAVWTPRGAIYLEDGSAQAADGDGRFRDLAAVMVACSNAHPDDGAGELVGDPTEVAMLEAADRLGAPIDAAARERNRRALFHFDPSLRRMSTVDERDGALWVDTKGAPEAVLPSCGSIASRRS